MENKGFYSYFGFDIRPFAHRVHFSAGQAIVTEGKKPDSLYFLYKGTVKFTLSQGNGKVNILNFVSAPYFIGEMELIDETRYPNGVTAIVDCSCYQIDIDRCRDLLLSDVTFLKTLCLFLSNDATLHREVYSRNVSFPLKNRLAHLLLTTSSNGLFLEKLVDIAAYLGVTYRHLLYTMADFVKRGYLVRQKPGYRIANEQALKKLAEDLLG